MYILDCPSALKLKRLKSTGAVAVTVTFSVFNPNPIKRLNSCPEIDPVQAITPYPSADKLELAKKSVKVLPIAKMVNPNKTWLIPCVIEIN